MARPVPLTYVPTGHDADRLATIYRRLLSKKNSSAPDARPTRVSPVLEDSNVTPDDTR